MAAPAIQPTPSLEDGVIVVDWDQTITFVDSTTSVVTVNIGDRLSVTVFLIGVGLTIEGSTLSIVAGVDIYAGETVTIDIEAGLVENDSAEANALIEDQAVLNRSAIPVPTRRRNSGRVPSRVRAINRKR